MSSREAFGRLFARLWVYRWRLGLSIAFACAIGALFTSTAVALGPLLALLAPGDGLGRLRARMADAEAQVPALGPLFGLVEPFLGDKETALFFIVGLVVAMGLLKNVLRYLQEYLAGWVTERLVVDLRNDMYAHVQRLPPGHFTAAGTQQMISRFVTDATQVGDGMVKLFARAAREPLKLVGAAAIVVWAQPWMAMVGAVVFGGAFALMSGFGRKIKRWVKSILRHQAQILGALAENFHGIRAIQVYRLEHHFEERFHDRNEQLFAEARRKVALDAVTSPLVEVMAHVVFAIVVLYTGLQVVREQLDIEVFGMFFMAAAMLFDPISKLSGMNNKLQAALAAAGRVFEVLDIRPAVADGPDARPLPRFLRELRFEAVSYEYPALPGEDRPPALHDIDLTIARGELIGIVGRTGAGKSTLVSLVPRFADPTAGRVTIDGVDLREARLADLRDQIAIVTQEHLLWDDTIAANIRLGRLGATDDEVEAAARAAHLHDEIAALPDGYATRIGEHGAALSGGQRQRVSLARAILKNPPILILDEATNALDARVEAEVQAALDAFAADRTTLVIAHRLSTLHGADRIVVLDGGRLEAVGSHDELMQGSGIYPDLYRQQFRGQGAS